MCVIYSQSKDLYKIKVLLSFKASGCFKNYSSAKRQTKKPHRSWLTSSKLRTWAAFSIKVVIYLRFARFGSVTLWFPLENKLKVSVSGIQVQRSILKFRSCIWLTNEGNLTFLFFYGFLFASFDLYLLQYWC